MKKQFEVGLDNPALVAAKIEFQEALKRMINKAVATGSMEGTATLKISVEIMEVMAEGGVIEKRPIIKYRAGWAVPTKESAEGKMPMNSQLVRNPEGDWCLISDQISMDELMDKES